MNILTIILAGVLGAEVPSGGQVQVQTLAGPSHVGRLLELSAERAVVELAGGRQTFAADALLAIVPRAAAVKGEATLRVQLVDGSQLAAARFTAASGKARIALPGGAICDVSTRAIASVRFREHSGDLAGQWADIEQAERAGDVIVVRKNDALDYLGGVLGDVTDEAVQFELDGEVRTVKRAKLDGLLYQPPADAKLAPARCVALDAAGSRVQLASLALADGVLRLRTPAGAELARPLDQWTRLDFSQGNLQYLSDLKPESVSWTPYFGASVAGPLREFYRPRQDRALEGGPLRLGGKEYGKGLALHSRSEIVYRLPEKVRTFRALAGIDDAVRSAGAVQLQILGDDRLLLDALLTGKDAPKPIELDVQGVRRLKIVVDFGEDLDVADHLDLCEARVLK